MPQNLSAYTEATTLEGAKQVIAQGPVASQEVIKMLGTNGGGFFNANSAHPFENPNAITNFVQMVLIFSIGAALTNVFGRMVGDQRQGWAVLAVMGFLFLGGVATAYESGSAAAGSGLARWILRERWVRRRCTGRVQRQCRDGARDIAIPSGAGIRNGGSMRGTAVRVGPLFGSGNGWHRDAGDGIFVEEFIEIAQAEHQERLRNMLLQRMVLPHQRRGRLALHQA